MTQDVELHLLPSPEPDQPPSISLTVKLDLMKGKRQKTGDLYGLTQG